MKYDPLYSQQMLEELYGQPIFCVCVINPEATLNEATLDKQSWCVFTVIP